MKKEIEALQIELSLLRENLMNDAEKAHSKGLFDLSIDLTQGARWITAIEASLSYRMLEVRDEN